MTGRPRGSGPSNQPVLDSVLRWMELVVSRSTRIPVLLAVAYLSGFVGVALSVFGGGDPASELTTYGIALMSVSFVCMFVVSITFHQLSRPGRS